MDAILNKRGVLSVITGNGYLSLYEANNLKKGDIIRVSSTCGKPFNVLYNGNFLCKGEICVIRDRLGFRISGFINDDQYERTPGTMDHIVEMVPVSIRVDEVELSLSELKGLVKGSFIGLEKKYNVKEDVELFVAGFPAACGKLVAIKENFGIKITKVYSNDQKKEIPMRISGNKIKPSDKNYPIQTYNFMRPDKFTWEGMIKIKNIHNVFLDSLKLMMPDMKNYDILEVDQLAFHEIFNKINKNYSYLIIKDLSRPDFQGFKIEKRSERLEQKYFIQNKNSKFPVPKDLIKYMKDIYKGKKKWEFERLLIFAYNKKSIFSKVNTENSIEEFIISPLRNGWKIISDVNYTLQKRADDIEEVKIVPDNDMILIIKIGVKGKPDTESIIIYPYITIEPLLPLLD